MSKKKFRPGQQVTFQFNTRSVQGVVKEDRGPIGMKGRTLYLIEFRLEGEWPEVSRIELPADRLTEVEGAVSFE
jgi:hypothetical protein